MVILLMEVRNMEENNKNPSPKRTNIKNFFNKLIDKDGFYIILFLCICIVATTAVWVSKNNLEKIQMLQQNQDINFVENQDPLEDDLIILEEDTEEDEPDIEVVEIQQDQQPENTKDEKQDEAKEEQKTKVVEASTPTTQETTTTAEMKQQEILRGMVVPLVGNISLDYAEDKLVYSKTLEQWTTHSGVDISAREGSAVRAVLDGTVSEIKNDPELGITITLDHGNGIRTKYGNLSTDEMVKVGQNIKKGDPISGVGKGARFELAQGPHLHFEVLVDGKNVDPKIYLPKFE